MFLLVAQRILGVLIEKTPTEVPPLPKENEVVGLTLTVVIMGFHHFGIVLELPAKQQESLSVGGRISFPPVSSQFILVW